MRRRGVLRPEAVLARRGGRGRSDPRVTKAVVGKWRGQIWEREVGWLVGGATGAWCGEERWNRNRERVKRLSGEEAGWERRVKNAVGWEPPSGGRYMHSVMFGPSSAASDHDTPRTRRGALQTLLSPSHVPTSSYDSHSLCFSIANPILATPLNCRPRLRLD